MMYDMPIFVDVYGQEAYWKYRVMKVPQWIPNFVAPFLEAVPTIFLGKLVMGLAPGWVPVEIFNFWDPPNFGLFNEFKNIQEEVLHFFQIFLYAK